MHAPPRAPSARFRPDSSGARTPNSAPQSHPSGRFTRNMCGSLGARTGRPRSGRVARARSLSRARHLAGADSGGWDPDRAGRGTTRESGGGVARGRTSPNGGQSRPVPALLGALDRAVAGAPSPESVSGHAPEPGPGGGPFARAAEGTRAHCPVGIVKIVQGPARRKGTRSRFRDPASRKRSPARSVRLVGAIRQPARRSRRRTRGELSFLLKRPSIPGTRMARR